MYSCSKMHSSSAIYYYDKNKCIFWGLCIDLTINIPSVYEDTKCK